MRGQVNTMPHGRRARARKAMRSTEDAQPDKQTKPQAAGKTARPPKPPVRVAASAKPKARRKPTNKDQARTTPDTKSMEKAKKDLGVIPVQKPRMRLDHFRSSAKKDSGQPQVVLQLASTVDPSGRKVGKPFFQILVMDAIDTCFSKPFAKKDVIGKSFEEIISLAENISDTAANIVGHARDRMTGIWVNDEYMEWPRQEEW